MQAVVRSMAEQQSEDSHAAHFFETAAMLISFILLGKYLECKAKQQTCSAIQLLMALQPPSAVLCHQDGSAREEEIDVDFLAPGDVVKVVPGAGIPADGTVIDGGSSVDESMITGEAVPVLKAKDDTVRPAAFYYQQPFIIYKFFPFLILSHFHSLSLSPHFSLFLLFLLTYALPLVLCTCCCHDVINGTLDLKIYSHPDSLILLFSFFLSFSSLSSFFSLCCEHVSTMLSHCMYARSSLVLPTVTGCS